MGIYDRSYELQMGQFYPERHRENLITLAADFPDYESTEIDQIYRTACRLETEIEQTVENSILSDEARRVVIKSMGEKFYGFSPATIQWALERVENRLD